MPSSDWLTQSVLQFLARGGNVLLPTAQRWVAAMTLAMVCYFAVHMMWEAVLDWPMDSARRFFLVWVPVLVTTNAFLAYYNTPFLGTGYSFHQIIPETIRYLTNLVNLSTMTTVTKTMENILKRVLPPDHSYDIGGWIAYYAAVWMVWLAEGLMFAYSTLSLVAVAVGITLGPLSIAMRVWPYMAHLFKNWVDFMISWGAYGLVLAVVLNIWANALILGLPRIFGASGIIEGLVLAKAFLLINAALWLACRKAEGFAAGLYGHAVSSAYGYPSYLRSWF